MTTMRISLFGPAGSTNLAGMVGRRWIQSSCGRRTRLGDADRESRDAPHSSRSIFAPRRRSQGVRAFAPDRDRPNVDADKTRPNAAAATAAG